MPRKDVSDFHYGLVHKPITIKKKKTMTIPEAKVAVAQTMEQAQELVSLGIHEFQIHGRSGSTGEKCKSCSLHPSWMRNLQSTSESAQESRALGGSTSKTTMDFMQWSQSKAHQFLKWQQDSWTRFPNFLVSQEKPTTWYQHERMYLCRKLLNWFDFRKRVLSSMDTTSPQSKTVEIQSKNQLFLLNETCTVILWKDCLVKGDGKKYVCNTIG